MASRYKKTFTSYTKSGGLKYDTTIYEQVPESNDDVYVITQEGDRLDKLANQFYGTPQMWWFIARVNNLKTMNLKAGTSLRIPASTEFARGD